MKRRCKQCKVPFEFTNKNRKFCSLKCCWMWRKTHKINGQFRKGIVPWNTGTKGICKPNSSSFQKGREAPEKLPIGTKTIRIDKQGKKRRWIKIMESGNPSDWVVYSNYKWEKYRGKLPQGWLVHHKDRDTLNDQISNLQPMNRANHLIEHRPEYEIKRSRNCSIANRKRHAKNRIKHRATIQTA